MGFEDGFVRKRRGVALEIVPLLLAPEIIACTTRRAVGSGQWAPGGRECSLEYSAFLGVVLMCKNIHQLPAKKHQMKTKRFGSAVGSCSEVWLRRLFRYE